MQIFVNIPGFRKTVSVGVKDADTIDVVKYKVQAKEGIHHDKYRLWDSGKLLEEDRTLFDYNIKGYSTLVLAESFLGVNDIKIQVNTLTGKKIGLHISRSAPVKCLKELIQDKEGIPPDQQRIIYSGCQLEDDKLLAFCNISNESVIHLILRLRGGARQNHCQILQDSCHRSKPGSVRS